MPLTLSAKFKVLQNQNYYGYHITGGKLFCTSVINSNFSHSKFKETEFHKCVFIDCIIQDVTLTRVSFVKCKFKNCIFTEFPEDKKGTCKFINCREEKEECF